MNDQRVKFLSSQANFLAGHCSLTGRYFEPCFYILLCNDYMYMHIHLLFYLFFLSHDNFIMPSIVKGQMLTFWVRQTRMISSVGSDDKPMKYILTNQPQISEAELDRVNVDPNSFRHT